MVVEKKQQKTVIRLIRDADKRFSAKIENIPFCEQKGNKLH